MEEIIDQRVALALSKQSSQQAPTPSGPNDKMSPSNKCKSSVASTEVTPATTEAATSVNKHRYPVDDITKRSVCELLVQLRNKMIVVAYGVTEKPTPGETFLNMKISTSYYTKVVVDRVVDTWDDLKLEVPGLDGE